MTPKEMQEFVKQQFPVILDAVPVGITVIDLDGRILYYNAYSATVLDRKPEYIGRDIRSCHRKTESVDKIDSILNGFKDGGMDEFYYESVRNGRHLAVTMTPFVVGGKRIGCIQSFVVERNPAR